MFKSLIIYYLSRGLFGHMISEEQNSSHKLEQNEKHKLFKNQN